jgi:hypothetical protein
LSTAAQRAIEVRINKIKKDKKMLKKTIAILTAIMFFNSCIVMQIKKDSEPLIDFGTPLIGHFRNNDIPKAVLYTVLFATSVLGIILFSPSQGTGNTTKAIIPIDRKISDPIFYSFLGASLASFAGSSIDTSVTYQMVNQKILELNGLQWKSDMKTTKYEFIKKFRDEEKKLAAKEGNKNLEGEIELYRKKIINGSITEDEIFFIEKNEEMKKVLEKELGYYYINKEIKKDRNK